MAEPVKNPTHRDRWGIVRVRAGGRVLVDTWDDRHAAEIEAENRNARLGSIDAYAVESIAGWVMIPWEQAMGRATSAKREEEHDA